MTDFVLLHGAFHGGWCWPRVAEPLRAAGHRVFTPTQTGLGERVHLLHAGITLDTFTSDLAGVLLAEELTEAVLVGHSFGGCAITGAADRMPERIRQLIYLDSVVPRDGRTPLELGTEESAALRRRLAEETGGVSIAPPDPSEYAVPPGRDADWLRRRMTPHPFGTLNSALRLGAPPGNGLPRTYVACTGPEYAPLAGHRAWVRSQAGWGWRDLHAGHDAMVTAPGLLVDILLELIR
jgi:pimeloyl-ACP methyl ester carboxylesterase